MATYSSTSLSTRNELRTAQPFVPRRQGSLKRQRNGGEAGDGGRHVFLMLKFEGVLLPTWCSGYYLVVQTRIVVERIALEEINIFLNNALVLCQTPSCPMPSAKQVGWRYKVGGPAKMNKDPEFSGWQRHDFDVESMGYEGVNTADFDSVGKPPA